MLSYSLDYSRRESLSTLTPTDFRLYRLDPRFKHPRIDIAIHIQNLFFTGVFKTPKLGKVAHTGYNK